MSENLYIKHKNIHTKTCMFTAPDAHIHTAQTSVSYTSIQPAGKVAEYVKIHISYYY